MKKLIRDPQKCHDAKGFTLVELAIVLVIIGLLVGGVLQGQELIFQSRIKRINSDIGKIAIAGTTFKNKFNCTPGDCLTATQFFGTATSCSDLSGAGTCNGDGNGFIDTDGSVNSGDINLIEIYRFWDHLSDAELIPGNYTGNPGPDDSSYDFVPGGNVMAGAMSGSCYGLGSVGVRIGELYRYDGNYGNALSLGDCTGPIVNYGPMFTPQEMYSFDIKYDDGKPAYGKVVSLKGTNWTPNCNSSTAMNATYNLAYVDKACVFFYTRLF